jgi:hypothetical protein
MSKLIITLALFAILGVFIAGCGKKQSTEVNQPVAPTNTKTDAGLGADDGSGKSSGGLIGDFSIDR